jgi:hypothetical protein
MMATNLLQKSSDWLETQRTKHAASTVQYVRGSLAAEVLATVGKTTFEVDDGYGVLIRHESRDFLILAADLLLDGHSILPQRGDCIRETQNGAVYSYEVMTPGKEPCWRYSDAFRKTLRVHTKQIVAEDTP